MQNHWGGQWLARHRSSFRAILFRSFPGLLALAVLTLPNHGAKAHDLSPRGEAWLPESGTASYYGWAHNGRRAADGSRFNQEAMTGAHPWLPFGTHVRVTAADTGRSVTVTITDRMAQPRRIIDLSLGAARRLGILHRGIARVSLTPAG